MQALDFSPPLWALPKPAIIRPSAQDVHDYGLPREAILPGMGLALGAVGKMPKELVGIIDYLGLSSGLTLCLDAGDENSYSSGYKWLDVSGNGQDFYRGSSANGDAAEPTFNGTPGGLSESEYWSFDGGDHFSYGTSNEMWMENLHRDNALHSIAFWFYLSSGTNFSLFATGNNAGGIATGYYVYVYGGSGMMVLIVRNGSGTAIQVGSGGSFSTGAWTFFGLSMDEAAGSNGLVMNVNGATSYHGSTYSAPSSGAAQMNPMRIGGDIVSWLPNGSRLAELAAWSGTAIGASGLDKIFQATRTRFGV